MMQFITFPVIIHMAIALIFAAAAPRAAGARAAPAKDTAALPREGFFSSFTPSSFSAEELDILRAERDASLHLIASDPLR
jgi:hypothetical protein